MIETVVAAAGIANGAVKLASGMSESLDNDQESDPLQKPARLLRIHIENSRKFRASDVPGYGEHCLRVVGEYSQYVRSMIEVSPREVSKHLMYAIKKIRCTDVIHLYKLTLKEAVRDKMQENSQEIAADDIIQVEFDNEKVLELFLLKGWKLRGCFRRRKITQGLVTKSRVYYREQD